MLGTHQNSAANENLLCLIKNKKKELVKSLESSNNGNILEAGF